MLLLLLVNQRDSLERGNFVPVGDLFEVIAEGDEPFTQAMRINFDNAKKLYRQKLLPMLKGEQGVTAQDVKEGRVEAARAQRFCNDDRLLKTLLLSALAPEVEAWHALTPMRLAALNHGTVRSPIPGQEGAIVLQRCRNWAAQVGEIKVSDDGPNPTISLHIVGVDTDGIPANAQSFDSYGNRIQKIRSLLYEQLDLDAEENSLLPPRYQYLWRGTWSAWCCWTISCRGIISIRTPGICRRSIASRRGCSYKTSAIRCGSACVMLCWLPTASARRTWTPSIPRMTSKSTSSRLIRR